MQSLHDTIQTLNHCKANYKLKLPSVIIALWQGHLMASAPSSKSATADKSASANISSSAVVAASTNESASYESASIEAWITEAWSPEAADPYSVRVIISVSPVVPRSGPRRTYHNRWRGRIVGRSHGDPKS